MTKRTSSLRKKPSGPPQPHAVYATEAGSLIEIHDDSCTCVVLVFSPDCEGACAQAQARPEIRGEGDVWLHWSCDCCGEAMVHCHPVETA